jgi:hypothetical protein
MLLGCGLELLLSAAFHWVTPDRSTGLPGALGVLIAVVAALLACS